jgi:HEAT repeat protein
MMITRLNCQERTECGVGLLTLVALVCVLASDALAQQPKISAVDDREANRKLTGPEMRRMLDASDRLVRRNPDDHLDTDRRSENARILGGELGHKYGIPALMAVIRDESEPESLRTDCVRYIGTIKDPVVIDVLIECLGDKHHYQVAAHARNRLEQLIGLCIAPTTPLTNDAESVQRREVIGKWKLWWQENKATAKLQRWKTMYSSTVDCTFPVDKRFQ